MKKPVKSHDVYLKIRQILESARATAARSVNTAQVMANWLIGREIVEEEQRGKRRAGYGEKLLAELSARLTEDVGKGWSVRNLEYCRNFYLIYPLLLADQKSNAPSSISSSPAASSSRQPVDVFKDPVVIEFLGLPESPRLVESRLEQALIDNLQSFLLELGKGFAFVSRQERITLDGDHFYIDLVFYHAVLKCYVLIDLKVGKLSHADLGQLQFYVNYFDRERRTEGDNPTLGLILCMEKNDAVVQYTLGEDQKKQIFTSRYKLHLPTEAELKAEIQRELKSLGAEITEEVAPARKRGRTE